MKITNKFRDIVALNMWTVLFTKVSWVAFFTASLLFYVVLVAKNFDSSNTVIHNLFKLVGGLGASFMLVAIISIPFFVISIMINLLIKGAVGERIIEINREGISEIVGDKITNVNWKDVKGIHFTKKYLFIKLTKLRYFIIPARDFDSFFNYVEYFNTMIQYKYIKKETT